jgi:hypothetical protein
MDINFNKAKHFWKNGEEATWIKSDDFSEKSFNELKKQYEELKYSKKEYLIIDDKILFLFYETKIDNFNRQITEITAIESDNIYKNNNEIYTILSNKKIDIFDNVLKYEIQIADKDIKRKNLKSCYKLTRIKFYIQLVLNIAMFGYILYLLFY